jgi:hypothetical protein
MFQLFNSIYYVVRVIIGLLLPHAKFTSVISIYVIIIGATYLLFRLHIDKLVGPWLIDRSDSGNNAQSDKNGVHYNDKEQTTIAIQFTSLVIFSVCYLMRDYVFMVPECVTINKLYTELETKLFWINNTYLSLMVGLVTTLAMIPVWRYCLSRLFQNDDQYRERFEQFVDKYFITFSMTCIVILILYRVGVTIHHQWNKRNAKPM